MVHTWGCVKMHQTSATCQYLLSNANVLSPCIFLCWQVLHLLRLYLGEYVRGLSVEALKISVWQGLFSNLFGLNLEGIIDIKKDVIGPWQLNRSMIVSILWLDGHNKRGKGSANLRILVVVMWWELLISYLPYTWPMSYGDLWVELGLQITIMAFLYSVVVDHKTEYREYR